MEFSSTRQAGNDKFRDFEIDGLISNQHNTRTGLREEILLVAWLLVLLRTREDGHVDYSWGHRYQTDEFELGSLDNNLLMNGVISGQQDSVGQAAQAISQHVAKLAPATNGTSSSPSSLLLCSSVCSTGVGEGKSEVSLHASSFDLKLSLVTRV